MKSVMWQLEVYKKALAVSTADSSYQSVTGISQLRVNRDRTLINWIKLEHKA